MSREQIEKMMKDICKLSIACKDCNAQPVCNDKQYAERFYNAGYRKQEQGEWLVGGKCTACNEYSHIRSKFCPNCGAKMKGGAE